MKTTNEKFQNNLPTLKARVKELYDKKLTTKAIAGILNAEGFRTEKNNLIYASFVSDILINDFGIRRKKEHTKNKNSNNKDFSSNAENTENKFQEQEEENISEKDFLNNIVIIKNNRALTTSLDISNVFQIRHDNVLQSIKNLECSDKFRLLNFQDTSYRDVQGKQRPMFLLTRDAFTILAFGFTGKKAMEFKEAYIEQFNKMEEIIKNQKQNDAPKTIEEMLFLSATALKQHKEEIDLIKNKIDNMDSKINEFYIAKKTTEKNNQSLFEPELATLDTFDFHKPERAKLKNLIHSYARLTKTDIQATWYFLYREFKDYEAIDLVQRRDNYNKNLEEKHHKSIIDIASELNLIPRLYQLMSKLYQDKKIELGEMVKEA